MGRMDAPLAPKLCGGVVGRALLAGVLPPAAVLQLSKPIEGGEVRRALFAPALQYVKVHREKLSDARFKTAPSLMPHRLACTAACLSIAGHRQLLFESGSTACVPSVQHL